MNKLILKAKGYTSGKKYSKVNFTPEDAGLALAYFMGQITGTQMRYAKDNKFSTSSQHGWAVRALITGIRQGWLQVK